MADTRVVRHLSTAYFVPFTSADGNKSVLVRTARRGDTIDPSALADGEVKRLEDLGAILPEGSNPGDLAAEQDAILDLYRGQRGDTDALQRVYARAGGAANVDSGGGIVDVTSSELPEGGARLADYITENKLTVDQTVELAGSDPAKARRVLEAERLASGGSPRAGVESGLGKLIGG